jgi:adenylate cyclase
MPVKILIVDDELDLQDLMKRKFRREIRHGEFSLDFATDGQAALDKVRADTEIDLVISDINMPGMDGLALLDHLAEFDDRLRTIIISAYGDMDNIRTAMNRGAFDFVTKPIDFPDLLITIKKTLDQLDVLREAIEHRMAAERARGKSIVWRPSGPEAIWRAISRPSSWTLWLQETNPSVLRVSRTWASSSQISEILRLSPKA